MFRAFSATLRSAATTTPRTAKGITIALVIAAITSGIGGLAFAQRSYGCYEGRDLSVQNHD